MRHACILHSVRRLLLPSGAHPPLRDPARGAHVLLGPAAAGAQGESPARAAVTQTNKGAGMGRRSPPHVNGGWAAAYGLHCLFCSAAMLS